MKDLVLRIDKDLYLTIYDRSKIKDITLTAELRNLIISGLNTETKNDNISYLIKKIENLENVVYKISNLLQLNYDLVVQEFVNKGYASNKKPGNDIAYQEFWANRRRDRMND